ncbi:MAG: DNA recombination protein RmuC [Chloroflexi bacterium]|nr:DNA recombination protein RmuC [Chloroflexota bacterium]
MDDFAVLIAGLDGLSIIIGLAGGFICAMAVSRFNRRSVLNHVSEHLADEVKNTFENVTETINTSVKSSSSEALKDSQEQFISVATDKFADQRQLHGSELESKKELIDTQLQQMSETLKTVPTELEKNQDKVADVLDKSTTDLKVSNQDYLNQLTEKAETQTEKHSKELDSKKELIDQRLTDMDVKLGKVERLVQDLQTDRKEQFGEIGERLQHLTTTTSALQQALADNRARGQWGERMAEDMLNFMGLVENVNYIKQASLESGSRPDFTFLLPNRKQLNMDAKFPLDNYMLYFNAESDADKKEYSQKFLRDVSQRVAEIQNRGYISAETLDCVLVFIPNEQVYRFIHEQDESIIDKALRQKVILCSPLTLYIVLAVIHQAAQNFNIEQRSREIVSIVEEIRFEWGKYSDLMDGMGKNFATLQNKFNQLTMTRTKALDRKFDKIEHIVNSNDDLEGEPSPLLISEN